jgi:ketosteroid isomerase-like protein
MRARKLVPLVVIAIVVALTARYLFWNPKREVRRQLGVIADIASVRSPETSIQRAARAERLGRFVTDDVILQTDSSTFVGGRPAVVRFAIEGGAADGHLTLACNDVQIEIIDQGTATAFLTLSVSHGGRQQSSPAPRQVHATFSKVGGQWLLSRGEVLRTLVEGQ